MNKPKVIFFDAVGTLFGVRGSVGEVYRNLALEFGIDIAPQILDESFRASFKAAPVPVFPGVELNKIPEQEFAWWQDIAIATFTQAGILTKFKDFPFFFAKLYNHFATDQTWYVYGDVFPTLQLWQQQGVELGIISNFDTRLYKVLKKLDLAQFFTSITIASESGAAKPDSHIFLTALAKHNCLPQEAWHIGDSFQEDYHAAARMGIKSYWLNRFQPSIIGENQLHNLTTLG
jgi:putative hydrolase of the HAD superfamily